MPHNDSGHESGRLSPCTTTNADECLIPLIADTAEKIHRLFDDMSLDMHNIEAIYARLPDAVKSYAVNWDKDSQETMENTKAMTSYELQQLLYLEILKNHHKDREIARLHGVEERLTLVETLIKKQAGFFATLQTEINSALLALSERELGRIEAFRHSELKLHAQTNLLERLQKKLTPQTIETVASPKSANKISPVATPEAELRRTIEALKKSMKMHEQQEALKASDFEDEIQRHKAKICQLEFILKTERDMHLKELNQRRSRVPNLNELLEEEKRNLECEYRAEMVQYKSKVDSDGRKFKAECEEMVKKERETVARLRTDRNKYAQMYATGKARWEMSRRISQSSNPPSSTNTSTTDLIAETSNPNFSIEPPVLEQNVAKEASTLSKGIDNCQLCNLPFNNEAEKDKENKPIVKERTTVFEMNKVANLNSYKVKLNEAFMEKSNDASNVGADQNVSTRKAHLYSPPASSLVSKLIPFRRRSKSVQQSAQEEQPKCNKNHGKHVKIQDYKPLSNTADRYSSAIVRTEKKPVGHNYKPIYKK